MPKSRNFIVFTILFLLSAFGHTAAFAIKESNKLDSIKFDGNDNRLEVTFYTTRKPDFSSYFLMQPDRFVVEIFNTSISEQFSGFQFSSPFVKEISGNFTELESTGIQVVFHLLTTVSYSFSYQNNLLHLIMIPIGEYTPQNQQIPLQATIDNLKSDSKESPQKAELPTTVSEQDKQKETELLNTAREKEEYLKRKKEELKQLVNSNKALAKSLEETLKSQAQTQLELNQTFQYLIAEERRQNYEEECLKIAELRADEIEKVKSEQDIEQENLDSEYLTLLEDEKAYESEQRNLAEWLAKLDHLNNSIHNQNRSQNLLSEEYSQLVLEEENIARQQQFASQFAELSLKQDNEQQQILNHYLELEKKQQEYETIKAKEDEQARERQRLAMIEEQLRLKKLKKQQEKQKLENLPVKKLEAPPKVAILKRIGFHPTETGSSVKLSFTSEVDVSYEWLSDYELAFTFTPSKIVSRINLLPLQTQAFGKNVLQIRPGVIKNENKTVITIDLMYKTAFKVMRNENEFELAFENSP